MQVINQELNYRYDALADVLYIYVIDSSDAEEAIELNPNMYLTIDEKDTPSAVELLDASKVLETTKFSLKRIQKIHLKIFIDKNNISVYCSLRVPVHNNELLKSTSYTIVNDFNLPDIEAKLAMA